jgi:GDP-L-fucose synthase
MSNQSETERGLRRGGMDRDKAIFVAGHRGMVGSAIVRCLESKGYRNIVVRSRKELDLTDQARVDAFFSSCKIAYVVIAAARVGGIKANDTYPAEFIYRNLMIEANLIHASWRRGVERLLFLGSSCIYPRESPQPMREEHLLTGTLEPTNEPYAVAKIAGIKLCESYNRQYHTDYRSVMPTNLYGPNDNYDLMGSHVLPALIRKFHLAKLAGEGKWERIQGDIDVYGAIPDDIMQSLAAISAAHGVKPPAGIANAQGEAAAVTLWGSGEPRREMLYVDDLAEASIFVLNLDKKTYQRNTEPMLSHINIGTGEDITIRELAQKAAAVVGYNGPVRWDADKPDGMMLKKLDVEKITSMGWSPSVSLEQGIRLAYDAYLKRLEMGQSPGNIR